MFSVIIYLYLTTYFFLPKNFPGIFCAGVPGVPAKNQHCSLEKILDFFSGLAVFGTGTLEHWNTGTFFPEHFSGIGSLQKLLLFFHFFTGMYDKDPTSYTPFVS